MRLGSLLASAVLISLCLVAGVPARAALVTETFNFSIGPFTPAAPTDPWVGSFTLTFDPTTTSNGVVTSFSSNAALLSGWDYVTTTTANSDSGRYALVIGNDCLGGTNCTDQTGSGFVAGAAFIQIDLGPSPGITTPPEVTAAEYVAGTGTSPGNPHYTASVNLNQSSVSVPEPASIAVITTAIALLGITQIRRGTLVRPAPRKIRRRL